MKFLITGGAGFMGSNFIRYILNKYPEHEVVNLDKLTYAGNLENLKDVETNTRYEFVKGDIADEKVVDQVMQKGIDQIVNFAAETHVDRSIHGAKSFIMTDVFGTYNLLEAAKKYKTQKYIQVSTDEVFGSTEDGEFYEDTAFEPNSPYSASKAGGDHLVRAYWKTYDLPTVVTHSCNFYGPYQYPEKLIPLFVTNLIEGKKIPVYGDGQQVREWIFVPDYCRALDTVIQKGEIGEVYNIGSGYRKANLEITNIILGLMGQGNDMIEYVKDRPGHDKRYAVNSDKLRKLGWKPDVQFEQGIKDTVEWYKENELWWKRLKSGEYLDYYKKQYG
ncbi:dTDP-glucose 4,6-dehydratase [Patescibacteria group bacterium]|nr:dTDP-glucose 4,6-dehydratase [Patescibacteria group bacterium]MBU1890119.1 dTDP-glucose 4,6-dehydratase [Patescibacteria group bacterium]